MEKWTCMICGFVYDEETGYPDKNIAPGTKYADLPDDFICPICGAGKDAFDN